MEFPSPGRLDPIHGLFINGLHLTLKRTKLFFVDFRLATSVPLWEEAAEDLLNMKANWIEFLNFNHI